MIGSGHIYVVIKNNRNLLRQSDKFNKTLSDSKKKIEFKTSEVSNRSLHHIKIRLEEERRNRFLEIILVFGLLISVLLSVFFHLL